MVDKVEVAGEATERVVKDVKTGDELVLVEWGDLRFWYATGEEASKYYKMYTNGR